jgi:hypothetical protein
MNRRGFFSTLAKVSAVFTILPSATTYARIWTPPKKIYDVIPEMPFDARDFAGKWCFIMSDFEKAESGLLIPRLPILELC